MLSTDRENKAWIFLPIVSEPKRYKLQCRRGAGEDSQLNGNRPQRFLLEALSACIILTQVRCLDSAESTLCISHTVRESSPIHQFISHDPELISSQLTEH